jgi:hypothetical protein
MNMKKIAKKKNVEIKKTSIHVQEVFQAEGN